MGAPPLVQLVVGYRPATRENVAQAGSALPFSWRSAGRARLSPEDAA
jgi:hypothetical protein